MSKSAVVIIPTTGEDTLIDAINSVIYQTYDAKALVVVDGIHYHQRTAELLYPFMDIDANIEVVYLRSNVGANGFYGHRIYAAFSHLVNEDYVFFLDQDNWFEPDHVLECVQACERYNLPWSYSLRNICDQAGNFICEDNCESLGKFKGWTGNYHIDTNCYCLRREVAVAVSSAWHGGYGQDRVFYNTLNQHFPNYQYTGNHSVNYRLGGNPGSVQKEFFLHGNVVMTELYKNNDQYNGKLPWRKP